MGLDEQLEIRPSTRDELREGLNLRAGHTVKIVLGDVFVGQSGEAGEASGPPVDLAGVLKGPNGPLPNWPFRLQRDGKPVKPGSLPRSATACTSRRDVWLTDGQGRYQFKALPAGKYQVVLFSAQPDLGPQPEEPTRESGLRADP